METLSQIKVGTVLANTYNNGVTVFFYKKLRNTKTGIEVYDYDQEEKIVIAGDPTVNAGFYHSNWFTKENKPELFETFDPMQYERL